MVTVNGYRLEAKKKQRKSLTKRKNKNGGGTMIILPLNPLKDLCTTTIIFFKNYGNY